jgi:phosphoribosylformylglycinamidine synthase
VTGGNVSFYNQSTDGGAVFPTPTIGMIGLLENKYNTMTLNFKHEGDKIYVIGENREDISSSQYLVLHHEINNSSTPYFDLKEELELQKAIKQLIKTNLINAAHDVSEGGLFCNLLEMSYSSNLGFKIETDESIRKDAFLFGENQSRVIVTVPANREDFFMQSLMKFDIDFSLLGDVKGQLVVVDGEKWGSVNHWKSLTESALSF